MANARDNVSPTSDLEELPIEILQDILSYLPAENTAMISTTSMKLNKRVRKFTHETFPDEYVDALPLLATYFNKTHIHFSTPGGVNEFQTLKQLPGVIRRFVRPAGNAERFFYEKNEEDADLVVLSPNDFNHARSLIKEARNAVRYIRPEIRAKQIFVIFIRDNDVDSYSSLRKHILQDDIISFVSEVEPTLTLAAKIVIALRRAIQFTVLHRSHVEWQQNLLKIDAKEVASTGVLDSNKLYQLKIKALNDYANAKTAAMKNTMLLHQLSVHAQSWPNPKEANYVSADSIENLNAKVRLIKRLIAFGQASQSSTGLVSELSAFAWEPSLTLVTALLENKNNYSYLYTSKYTKQLNAAADVFATLEKIVSTEPTPAKLKILKEQISQLKKVSSWRVNDSSYYRDNWYQSADNAGDFFSRLFSTITLILAVAAIITVAVLVPPIFILIPCAILLLTLAYKTASLYNYYNPRHASQAAEVITASKAWSAFFTTPKKSPAVSDIDNSLKKR